MNKRTKWRGDESTMIDRFDARAHLDYLVDYKDPEGEELGEVKDNEERMLNYERYRTLVQNEAVGSKQKRFTFCFYRNALITTTWG